jgi:TIR domain/Clp amino terminal domain, pathogenicity island component
MHPLVLQVQASLTTEAWRSLELAEEEAARLGGLLGTEHVLLGLLREGEGLAAHVLQISGVSLDAAREQVRLIAGPGQLTGKKPLWFTPQLHRALELAMRESVEDGTRVNDRHLLLGILGEGQGAAVDVLTALDVDLRRLASRARSIVSKEPPDILRQDPRAPPAPSPPTGRLFISYRRRDSSGYAGRLYDRLAERYGNAQVFMDVVSIEPGRDVLTVIETAVGSCAAQLVLIGSGWTGAIDGHGRRRLDDPDDVVRLEVEAAFKRDILVIPVLLDDASMPPASDLPGSLALLSRRHAFRLRHESFDDDVRRLIEVLSGILESPG